MIGRTLGKYRIVGQLGRGGAGVVYKAVDETLNRDVAIKTLSPDLANTEVMTRFRAEATILARLNHPQIATIYELFKSEGDLLMVMEFVRGESLDKLTERLGPVAPDRAAYLIDLILQALEHAHGAGIVHRDIKPANVMVTDEGGVKIMDFGIARVLGAEQKTVDFRLMGTPAYMSPEQVMGEVVDGRSDLYSVGVLFYRLLSGALPFSADTALAMLQRQIRDTPIPLTAHGQGLPDWCDQIVQRALAKTPADRFQTAVEFRSTLATATGPLPMADLAKTFAAPGSLAPLSTGITDTINLTAGAPVLDRRPPAALQAPTKTRRARLMWVRAAAVVLLVGAVAARYIVLREEPTEAAIEVPPPPELTADARAMRTEPLNVAPQPSALAQLEPLAGVVSRPPERIARPARERPATADVPDADGASRSAAARPPIAPVVETPAPLPEPPPPAPVAAPVIDRRVVRADEADPSLVFETRALVGTLKPREQSAQLVLGEGKITIIPQDDPSKPLCSFPYGRVISISVSRNRDPLWNSPQGPAVVARAGGTIRRLGITVSRDWIALRTSTEEQFVAVRFDEVLLKRVLLALEERTGQTPVFVELPREER
jgi:serine/threonine-protein kinase